MSDIETVGQARAIAESSLSVRCDVCRVLHHVHWRLLQTLKDADRIDGLHTRLKCRHCGARPTAENVGVYIRPPGPSGGFGRSATR